MTSSPPEPLSLANVHLRSWTRVHFDEGQIRSQVGVSLAREQALFWGLSREASASLSLLRLSVVSNFGDDDSGEDEIHEETRREGSVSSR